MSNQCIFPSFFIENSPYILDNEALYDINVKRKVFIKVEINKVLYTSSYWRGKFVMHLYTEFQIVCWVYKALKITMLKSRLTRLDVKYKVFYKSIIVFYYSPMRYKIQIKHLKLAYRKSLDIMNLL